jgi:hypothetical protein
MVPCEGSVLGVVGVQGSVLGPFVGVFSVCMLAPFWFESDREGFMGASPVTIHIFILKMG